MATNYFIVLDQRARDVLCSAHRTEMVAATMQVPPNWEDRRRHGQRIEQVRLPPTDARIALDQAEFELLGGQVPA